MRRLCHHANEFERADGIPAVLGVQPEEESKALGSLGFVSPTMGAGPCQRGESS